jgi:LCP family protein required for cell wall assembly
MKRREEEERKKRLCTLLQRTLIILLALLCSALLIAGLAQALGSLKLLSLKTITSVTGGVLDATPQGQTNILLLGQGDEEQGKDLTDSILVISLDPKETQSAVLISIPRDLYFVKTETLGSGRLNSLYRDRKYALQFRKGLEEEEASAQTLRELKEEIGRMIGEDVHYVAKVHFQAFVDMVDALGGIDIDVPEGISDPEFPGPHYTFEPFEITKGPHHLDGVTALKYARSRSTTSDFDRSKRQQQILVALVRTAMAAKLHRNPGKLLAILRDLSPSIETDMTSRGMLGLALAISDTGSDRVITTQLSDRNGLFGEPLHPGGFLYNPPRDLFDGASVLLPLSIPEIPVTWKQIQAFTTLLFDHRNLFLKRPSLSILNAGAPGGSALKLGNELQRFGLEVTRIANAKIEKQADSSLILRDDGYTPLAEDLGSMLEIPARPFAPGLLDPELVGDLTLVLGKNFTFRPLQSLLHPL